MKPRALALWVVAAAACGPTVGDPCTTAQDCLGRACLNGGSTPGGYCTVQCTMDGATACPTGTTCVREAIAGGVHGCMRVCATARDCRGTYRCERERGSEQPVCTGPNGL